MFFQTDPINISKSIFYKESYAEEDLSNGISEITLKDKLYYRYLIVNLLNSVQYLKLTNDIRKTCFNSRAFLCTVVLKGAYLAGFNTYNLQLIVFLYNINIVKIVCLYYKPL